MNILFGIIMIIIGTLYITKPSEMIRFRHIFYIRGGEPTEFAIFMTVVGGGIFIILGIVLLFTPFS